MDKILDVDYLEKFNYFQDVQLWPLDEQFNYKGWLNNFDAPEDIEIAKDILSFFVYIPQRFIHKMISYSVGECGYYMKLFNPAWNHDDFYTNCIYSYIPGEEPSVADSGCTYARLLKTKLNIPKSQIYDYDELVNVLENSRNQNVILVDDVIGTGAQCDTAWNTPIGKAGKILKDIVGTNKHNVIYAPLVINVAGLRRITNNCCNLMLATVHVLTEEYNLFNPNCPCWKGDSQKFKKGTEMIFRKSREQGIPDKNGHHVNDIQGFGRQGLALAFDDFIPDACPAFFYWESETWTPLIKKQYHRH